MRRIHYTLKVYEAYQVFIANNSEMARFTCDFHLIFSSKSTIQTVCLLSRVTVNVLLVWLENFPGDFTKDSNCKLLKQLQMFAKNELKEKRSQEVLRKTQQLLENTSPSLKHGMISCFMCW